MMIRALTCDTEGTILDCTTACARPSPPSVQSAGW